MGLNRNINMDMWHVFESPNALIYDFAYIVTFMSWLLSSHLQMRFMGFLFNSSFGGLVLSAWCLTRSIADPKLLELKVLVSFFVWPIWFLSLIFEPSSMLVTFWLLPPPPHYLGLVKGFKLILCITLFSLNFFDWYIMFDVW